MGTDAMTFKIELLNALRVKNAKVGLHSDGGGLYLQVTPAKGDGDRLNKSWLFRYELAGRRREMGIGSLRTVSLAEARAKVREARQLLLLRCDPLEARKAAEAAQRQVATTESRTFKRCAVDYMAAHEAGWRNSVHRKQWASTLGSYAYPVIGTLPVDQVTTDHVIKILSPIWATKNETASRLRGRIEVILDAARVAGYRSGDNPARWGGHLQHLLAPRKKVKKGGKHPALPWLQMPQFMTNLRDVAGIASKALEFAILTAARSGEVRGMTWDEIAGDVWTVPKERMKGGVEHRVPLTARALEIIAYMRPIRQNDYVFPGEDADAQMSDMTLIAVIRRMNQVRTDAGLPMWVDPKQGNREVVPHGLRSSFKDWADESEENAFPSWLSEAALSHASGDKVEAAYKRGDALAKRRKLIEAWAEFCGRSVDHRNEMPTQEDEVDCVSLEHVG